MWDKTKKEVLQIIEDELEKFAKPLLEGVSKLIDDRIKKSKASLQKLIDGRIEKKYAKALELIGHLLIDDTGAYVKQLIKPSILIRLSEKENNLFVYMIGCSNWNLLRKTTSVIMYNSHIAEVVPGLKKIKTGPQVFRMSREKLILLSNEDILEEVIEAIRDQDVLKMNIGISKAVADDTAYTLLDRAQAAQNLAKNKGIEYVSI